MATRLPPDTAPDAEHVGAAKGYAADSRLDHRQFACPDDEIGPRTPDNGNSGSAVPLDRGTADAYYR